MATKKKVVAKQVAKKQMTSKKNQSKPKPIDIGKGLKSSFNPKTDVPVGKGGMWAPNAKSTPKMAPKMNRNTIRKAANQAFRGY